MVHLDNGLLFDHTTFCKSMDGTAEIMLSEIRQDVKDKYHMISPISILAFFRYVPRGGIAGS